MPVEIRSAFSRFLCLLTFCPWSHFDATHCENCYWPLSHYDATHCSIAAQFLQCCKYSESANLLRKLLLPHIWAGLKVKTLFVQAQSILTFLPWHHLYFFHRLYKIFMLKYAHMIEKGRGEQ
jgi:hypothetical protein